MQFERVEPMPYKRTLENFEASGEPLQAAKLRRRDVAAAAKDTLRHLHSASHVITPEVVSKEHRDALEAMIAAVKQTVELLENTDKNSEAAPAPEEEPFRPTSPSYSPTSPKYDPMGGDEADEPRYAVAYGPAAEPEVGDRVFVDLQQLGRRYGVLKQKNSETGVVEFSDGEMGAYDIDWMCKVA